MSAGKPEIVICLGSSCFARGNARNVEATERFLAERNLIDEVDVNISGGMCAGCCAEGPNVIINGKVYHRVDAGVMLDLLKKLFPER